jgi:uncharacterized protein (DUF58 family)
MRSKFPESGDEMTFPIPGPDRPPGPDRIEHAADLLRRAKKVRIGTRGRVHGLYSASHRSLFRGCGVEYADLREYVPGDDVRAIEWNVTARLNHPYVKEYLEDREQTFYVAVDLSGSGSFGADAPKVDMNREIAASIIIAAQRDHERIGLCLFTDRIERFIPAGKGKRHMFSLLEILASYRPVSKKTDMNPVIAYFSRVVKKHCSLIILSDFECDPCSHGFSIIRHRHEVTAIRITDPRESEIPGIGMIVLEDPETGAQVSVNTSDPVFRERYDGIIGKQEKELSSGLKKCGTRYIGISSADPYGEALGRLFLGNRRGP